MNTPKTAEQLELAKEVLSTDQFKWYSLGVRSRDEEVNKLVEALEKIAKNVNAIPSGPLDDVSVTYELRVMGETNPKYLMNIAAEALLPYTKTDKP